jgi:hypothetical protein
MLFGKGDLLWIESYGPDTSSRQSIDLHSAITCEPFKPSHCGVCTTTHHVPPQKVLLYGAVATAFGNGLGGHPSEGVFAVFRARGNIREVFCI